MTKRRGTSHRREQRLLLELQREHGYMFHTAKKADQRGTMIFQTNKKTGKSSLVAAQFLRLIVPATSWLAGETTPRRREPLSAGPRRSR